MRAIRREMEALRQAIKPKAPPAEIDIKGQIAPCYWPVHDDIAAGAHRFYNLPGGRGSGKSSFISLEIVAGVMQGGNAVVFRRIGATMRDSVFSQIAWAVDALGVSSLWRGCVSPMLWEYTPTGAQIIFRGLDDPSKLKSIKPRHGVFRFAWFEEFSELPGVNFQRSILQSVGRGTDDLIVFRSFNPPISASNWANAFVREPDEQSLTVLTNYTMLPPEWLGKPFLYEAERLKTTNEAAYRHEYLGEATGSGGNVFPTIEARTITDEEAEQQEYIYCGIDFGFSVDPAACVRLAYDRKTESIIFLGEIYARNLSNVELAEEIKRRHWDTMDGLPLLEVRHGIYIDTNAQDFICDSAEPKSIADLKDAGISARRCTKGPVLYGIRWLQRRRLVIDPQRTPNIYREFTEYEYSATRDGTFLADVPDKNNHTIDATRYALEQEINRRENRA